VVQVCVVGSVNMDLVFDVQTLPEPGQTILASGLHQQPGGKGGNQAVAAARAGAEVTMVAAVGHDDNGKALRAHLRDNAVGLFGVVRLPVPSGTAAIMVGSGAENMIVVAPGANAHLTLDHQGLRDTIADADVVLISLEIPVETALAAARQSHLSGGAVILNASPTGADPVVLEQLADVVDAVVVNETEAHAWTWPVPWLVTTRGARGATLEGNSKLLEFPAPAVEAIDTSGAGDVFAGVLAANWLGGHPRAVRMATAAGALATLKSGAGDCAPYAEAIDDILD